MSLVITGNPGVGKHTVGLALAAELRMRVVDLNEAAVQSGAVQTAGGAYEVDTEALGRKLRGDGLGGAVVIGHLAPYVLDGSQVQTAIVLRRSPYALGETYTRRRYSRLKALENQGSEILGVIAHDAETSFGRQKVVQIDTTGRSVGDTVAAARMAAAGRLGGGDRVDWLGLVEGRGELGRFFPE